MTPIRSVAAIDSIVQKIRPAQAAGQRIVFTNGCFDILHPGHIDLLRRARRLGDRLIVAINSDASVRRLKGENRPVFPENERAELLLSLEMVDHVCIFDEDTPLQCILKIRPDVLVKGGDWGLDDIVGRKEVESWGGEVQSLRLMEGQSTTGVIERILGRFGSEWKS